MIRAFKSFASSDSPSPSFGAVSAARSGSRVRLWASSGGPVAHAPSTIAESINNTEQPFRLSPNLANLRVNAWVARCLPAVCGRPACNASPASDFACSPKPTCFFPRSSALTIQQRHIPDRIAVVQMVAKSSKIAYRRRLFGRWRLALDKRSETYSLHIGVRAFTAFGDEAVDPRRDNG